jgi:hypothetical protein
MRSILASTLGGTLLLAGCAPAILSVQADPPAPREGMPFVVKAAIKTTDASQQPTLGINQSFPLPAAAFGPVPMGTVSASGNDLTVQSPVPGGALTPPLSYGSTLQFTVSVPWRDQLAQTNVVRATLPLTIGAPANCRSFDDPERTTGWQIKPFQRISFSSTGQVTVSDLGGVPAGLTWTPDDNYPYPVPQQGAVRLKLPP